MTGPKQPCQAVLQKRAVNTDGITNGVKVRTFIFPSDNGLNRDFRNLMANFLFQAILNSYSKHKLPSELRNRLTCLEEACRNLATF